MPTERPLSDDERSELSEAAQRGLRRLADTGDDPASWLGPLEAHIEGRRRAPRGRDEEAFELGAVFAAVLELVVGWELVELSWKSGLVAIGAVEMDRSLVILPFHAVAELFERPSTQGVLDVSVRRLAGGERPRDLRRDGFAVLLP